MNLDTLPLSRKQVVSIVESVSGPQQISVWTGAVAAGKTVASLLAFLIAVKDAPKSGLIVMVGWTLQSIERNLIDPLQDERLFGEYAALTHHTTGSTMATILGRQVHLIGASDARAEARIRGATISLAYLDEIVLLPESFWIMMLSRLRMPNSRLYGTTNPASSAHWLRRDFILRADEVGMRTWHFTLDDNPFLEPGFVELTKARYTGLWYKRFILGLWVAAEGVVYDMWDEDHMIVDVLPPITSWLCCAIDYGSRNPLHALVMGIGADRRIYVVDEWRYDGRQKNRTLSDVQYSERIRAWLDNVKIPASRQADGTWMRGIRPQYVLVDPSALSFKTQLNQDGLSAVSANNDVLDGIRSVSSLMAAGRLRLSRDCPELAAELSSYSWDDRAAMLGEDKPIKVDDHGADSLRYGIYSTRTLWQHQIPLTQAA